MIRVGLEDLKDGDYILLGQVTRPFGLKGEVRIRPFNPFSETFEQIKILYLRPPGGELKEFKIERIRRHQDVFLIKFEGFEDRNRAEEIRGWEVLVRKDQLAPPGEDEYYWFQLLGLRVRLESGEEVGQVVRIEETNPYLDGNDVLVIKTECHEVMIPFVDEVVKKVDLEKGEIIVSEIEGYKQ